MPDTFHRVWIEAVRNHEDRDFLVYSSQHHSQLRWTYGEFDAVVKKTASRLSELGVTPGACVHVVLGNSPSFVAVWLAVSSLGAWMVPVDPETPVWDLSRQIQRITPSLAVCGLERLSDYKEANKDQKEVPVISLAGDASDFADGGPLYSHLDGESANPRPQDRLAVMFTSGTTAEPKGVVLTQANYANVAESMSAVINLAARHRWFVSLPLFHANAQYYCFAPAMATGASVALVDRFSASGWVSQARELQATHASLFAAPIRMILARTPNDCVPLQLEHVWFAQNLGKNHYEDFTKIVGTRPRQLYGMTETVAIVSADLSANPGHDTIGRPALDRRVRIDEMNELQSHNSAAGELLLHGRPGHDIFEGYMDDADKTAEAFIREHESVWFRTGDLVARQESGEMYFLGRKDDVIKVSGENVSLTEVEAVVAQAPGVLEVAVVAVPDEVRDMVPEAFYVPKSAETPPTAEELSEWASRNLPRAARPRAWHLMHELPRTSVGKIRRHQIRTSTASTDSSFQVQQPDLETEAR